MAKPLTYVVFIVGIAVLGGLIGVWTLPGEWYARLQKPSFTPPNWVFGPVWTILYVMIGWVGARKWLYGGAAKLWWAQVVLNFIWSPVFFGLHMPGVALVIIALMWILIAAFIRREWVHDRLSALLFLPYLAWVTLASALNAGIVVLN